MSRAYRKYRNHLLAVWEHEDALDGAYLCSQVHMLIVAPMQRQRDFAQNLFNLLLLLLPMVPVSQLQHAQNPAKGLACPARQAPSH